MPPTRYIVRWLKVFPKVKCEFGSLLVCWCRGRAHGDKGGHETLLQEQHEPEKKCPEGERGPFAARGHQLTDALAQHYPRENRHHPIARSFAIGYICRLPLRVLQALVPSRVDKLEPRSAQHAAAIQRTKPQKDEALTSG